MREPVQNVTASRLHLGGGVVRRVRLAAAARARLRSARRRTSRAIGIGQHRPRERDRQARADAAALRGDAAVRHRHRHHRSRHRHRHHRSRHRHHHHHRSRRRRHRHRRCCSRCRRHRRSRCCRTSYCRRMPHESSELSEQLSPPPSPPLLSSQAGALARVRARAVVEASQLGSTSPPGLPVAARVAVARIAAVDEVLRGGVEPAPLPGPRESAAGRAVQRGEARIERRAHAGSSRSPRSRRATTATRSRAGRAGTKYARGARVDGIDREREVDAHQEVAAAVAVGELGATRHPRRRSP